MPPFSSISVSAPLWELLNSYLETLTENYPEAIPLMAGDFNARLGSDNETLANYLNWDNEDAIPYPFMVPRKSRDQVIN